MAALCCTCCPVAAACQDLMSAAGAAIHKFWWLLPKVLVVFAFSVVISGVIMELLGGMVALTLSAGSKQSAAWYHTEQTAGQGQHPA